MMLARWVVVVAGLLFWIALPLGIAHSGERDGDGAAAPATSETDEPEPEEPRRAYNQGYLDRVAEILRENFFDSRMFREQWPTIYEQHHDAILAATDNRELHAALVAALAEFGVSHLSIIPQYVWDEYVEPEFENRLTLRAGVVLERINGKYFCLGVSAAAREAGLLRGDEVLTVYGEPVAESERVYDVGSDYGISQNPRFVVHVTEGSPVELTFRRQAEGKPRSASFEAVVSNDIEATRNSVRVLEEDGMRVGYVHCVHFMHGEVSRIVWTALRNELADCDALILDLRGSGGSPMVIRQLLAPFYPENSPQRRRMSGAPLWQRPVVALIDGNARSAKEVFAHSFQRDELGLLVGRPTAGAVIGASFPELPDGARLIVPMVAGARYTRDRVDLEGNPVEPHIHVPGTLKYARGHDEIFAAGRKAAFDKLRRANAERAPAKATKWHSRVTNAHSWLAATRSEARPGRRATKTRRERTLGAHLENASWNARKR